MERSDSSPHCEHCGLYPVAPMTRSEARIVCESAVMRDLLLRAARVAASDAPVVMFGESGTGKEIVARLLHANGPRSDKAFVAVNVAALPAELLESELFGHAKGAFTGAHQAKRGLFEIAEGGTLFLDEIGEMPLELQAKLLRALADGEVRRVGDTRSFGVDARIVCATHRDLRELVRTGRFREDLYYRLKVLTLRVPALRERTEDILPLAMRFLSSERTDARGFTKAAESALRSHTWPGNVRELQNAVKHGAALATGTWIAPEDLPPEVLEPTPISQTTPSIRLRSLAEVEREHLLGVLEACGGSVGDAARILEIGRNTLWRKLKSYS